MDSIIIIPDKIFEADSSFHVKQRTAGKVQFSFSGSFVLVLTEFSFQKEDWVLGYNPMKFRDLENTQCYCYIVIDTVTNEMTD